jgi:hypothetical protein
MQTFTYWRFKLVGREFMLCSNYVFLEEKTDIRHLIHMCGRDARKYVFILPGNSGSRLRLYGLRQLPSPPDPNRARCRHWLSRSVNDLIETLIEFVNGQVHPPVISRQATAFCIRW